MAETLPITIKVHVELDEDSIAALSDKAIEALADRLFAAIRRRQAVQQGAPDFTIDPGLGFYPKE